MNNLQNLVQKYVDKWRRDDPKNHRLMPSRGTVKDYYVDFQAKKTVLFI